MTTQAVVQVPLAEVADVIRGVTFRKSDASDFPTPDRTPILRAGNIGDDLELERSLVWVPSELVSPNQWARLGDIVMCASSGSSAVVGKSAPLWREWSGAVGAFCVVIRTKSTLCNPDFLGFFLKGAKFRQWTRNAAGASIKNIRKSDLESFPIPLPPLDEQRRIVGILNRAAKIERLRLQAAERLREFVPALFIKMFGDPVENPMGWRVEQLGNLIAMGLQNGLYKPKSEYGLGTRILRIDNFYRGYVTDPTSWKRVRLDNATIKKYALTEDDIVVNRVNSRPFLGKSAIIPKILEPAVFESNMMRMKVDSKKILPKFLISMFQIGSIRQQLCLNAKDAINQSSINQTDVCELSVIVPPLGYQCTYSEVVKKAGVTAAVAEAISKISSTLTISLTTRLLGDYT